jgi:hypothetical protein
MSNQRDALTEAIITGAVELAFGILTIVLMKKVMAPDVMTTLRLRSAQTVKRVAQHQADQWQRIANNAATAYHKARI